MLLEDDPYNRTEPVRKCGQVAAEKNYEYFGVALGLCFSGSHDVSQFKRSGPSTICQNGTGNYFGYFAMNLYQITNKETFLTSAVSAENCGLSYCMNNGTNNIAIGGTGLCISGSAATVASLLTIVLVAMVSLLVSVEF